MAQPISLHSLLIKAFADLQAHDEAGDLREFADLVSSSSALPNGGSILDIRSNAASNNWLLLALMRSRGNNLGQTLVVTSDRRAHLLGHAMLASCLPKRSRNEERLTHAHYMSLAGVCNFFQENPLSLLVRNKHQGNGAFIHQIVRHILTASPTTLIIDRPNRCFPKQPKGSSEWPYAIPPSVLTVTSIHGVRIIVLRSE